MICTHVCTAGGACTSHARTYALVRVVLELGVHVCTTCCCRSCTFVQEELAVLTPLSRTTNTTHNKYKHKRIRGPLGPLILIILVLLGVVYTRTSGVYIRRRSS